ncbi:MAG: methyltransferase domain-containing protein [Alphaproteobacteria bacterium]
MQLAQEVRSGFAAIVIAAAGAFAGALPAAAQDASGTFVGDVPYVATPKDVVETMLDLAKVGAGDYVIDLGSGDGRLVVAAALRGAEGFGVDLDPKRIAESHENARKAGVADRAQFFQRDLFETDFARATVLTMYLLPDINLQLRPKVLGLKPGTRVVSHDFDMGDWTPDERVRMVSQHTHYESNAYLWIVPAKVAGRWQGDNGQRFEIVQSFQKITVSADGVQAADARLFGDKIGFSLAGRAYDGRIDGDLIKGVARAAAGETPWIARRVSSP